MNLGFSHPLVLIALIFALLPWWRLPTRLGEHAWLGMLPRDGLSRGIDIGLRAIGSLAIIALVIGLAGPFTGAQTVERVANGAHIALVLDRSLSMNETFAGETAQGGEESKSQTARRLLTRFIDERPHDLFGVVAFSTRPMPVLPLTEDHRAVLAAVQAATTRGMAQTDVAGGLLMALSYFNKRQTNAGTARAIVLLSDGAAALETHKAAALRAQFAKYNVSLYWLYLRSAGNPGLSGPKSRQIQYLTRAALVRNMNQFFQSLATPYKVYQADNPAALAEAVAAIDRLERQPLVYEKQLPRRDHSGWLYGLAAALFFVVVGGKALERELLA